jgi:hypothetical protein
MTTEETLNVKIEKELLEKFRQKAQEKYGFKRGYIKKATTESIKLFIEIEGE